MLKSRVTPTAVQSGAIGMVLGGALKSMCSSGLRTYNSDKRMAKDMLITKHKCAMTHTL